MITSSRNLNKFKIRWGPIKGIDTRPVRPRENNYFRGNQVKALGLDTLFLVAVYRLLVLDLQI